MTNFEKHKNELIDIMRSGDSFCVTTTGKLIECSVIECEKCVFGDHKKSCIEGRKEWINEEIGGEAVREEILEVREDLAEILAKAYITCVSDIISGNVGTGANERDMDTLYGIFQLYRQARMLMAENGRREEDV